ncbi:MAG: TetR-like C-terminal domain-containing protein [Candidatus Competibacterales bacterium]|nr:TetR-like C-terminal domain-containing protein [Candidatus Competibacterales bacterium]
MHACGHRCFGLLIEQVALFCRNQGIAEDARPIAVQLWTFVHGTASLLIDGDYEEVAIDVDVDAMILDAGRRLLAR